MRNVNLNYRYKAIFCASWCFLFGPGCFNAAIVYNSNLKLAFPSPLNSPYFPASQNSISSIQVAVENSDGTTATSGGPYTISLAVYLDSACQVPYLGGGTNNSVGNPTQTVNGIASVNTQSGGGGSGSPTGTIYIQASSSGFTSVCSSSVTFPTSSAANLVVPIEMLNTGAQSSTSTTTLFTRTQSTLDSNAYDGSPAYFFEVVASNTDSVSHNIYLVDSTPATYATLAIPAGASYLRVRGSFVPASGNHTYMIMLDASASSTLLTASAARMIVVQTGATKTKIYIPLVQALYSSANPTFTNVDYIGGSSAAFNTSTYTGVSANLYPYNTNIWMKNSGAYANLSGSNPWTLEAVMMASSNTVSGLLFNMSGTPVAGSSVATAASIPTLVSSSFSDSATNFGNGQTYEFSAYTSNGTAAYIFRAGLWVTLSGISAAEIYNRVYGAYSAPTNTFVSAANRIFLDLSQYSNPNVYFETTSGKSAGPLTTQLMDCGVNDTGTSCSAVAGSSVVVSTSSSYPNLSRTSSFSITNGDRYIYSFSFTVGMGTAVGAFAVVTIQP